MRSYLLSLIILCSAVYHTSYAQDASKLTLPASPAFSILGFEPSAVMRPTDAKSLATDVLNSFDKNGNLLLNLGLETTPYWLGSHPNLKMDTYLSPSLGQTILQSFSLSSATVKDSISGDNKLGIGFRFKLYNGEASDELKEELTVQKNLKSASKISEQINGVLKTFDNTVITTKQKAIDAIKANLTKEKINQALITAFDEVAKESANGYADTEDDIVKFLTQLNDDWVNSSSFKNVQAKVSDLIYQRKGFVVELAGASGYNTSRNNSLEKIGFWANISRYVSPDDLFTFTARYMYNNNDTAISNFDAGLSFLKKTDKFNISIEALLRFYRTETPDFDINNAPITKVEKKTTYRFAVQGAYNISDVLSLNLSFGKDFDSPIINKTAFFSILGLNYSIFNKQVSKLTNK